jgi:hypothetical protein
MGDFLEGELIRCLAREAPTLVDCIRELKRLGAEKSEVVERVTRQAARSALLRPAILILVDKIWME